MRKIKEILRLRVGEKRTLREVASSVGVSPSMVHSCVVRARAHEVDWLAAQSMDDETLEKKLYGDGGKFKVGAKAIPDVKEIHKQLRRKGVTLYLLWQEYKAAHQADGYQYTQFCEHYRQYRAQLDVVFHQEHTAGEKLFVDWSEDGIPITDRLTGEVKMAPLFVAVLGASNYTFVKVAESKNLWNWIRCHIAAFEFFGGIPEIVVPDNTKTAVTKACNYEPDINPTYHEMVRHYGTAVIPARPRKPRDKAKVETGVLLAQRWIIAALRNHTFFTIGEAAQAVARKVTEMNLRRFQKLDSSRLELFEQLDKPALSPLPEDRYEYADWSKAKVNVDYHIAVDKHYYSVPYKYVQKTVEARFTGATVEIFFKGRRITSHERSYKKWGYSTKEKHMPEKHRKYLKWNPSRISSWADKVGPHTKLLVQKIMDSKPHPELGYKACLGVLRLSNSYDRERLEAACRRALDLNSASYKTVKSTLKYNLENKQLPQNEKPRRVIEHENVRGADYYN
ncbi:MAG: IS21 family transposase [bacterium]|nr:IS21 family transposase [bacterium]